MKIQICTGKACKSRFSEYILKRLERDIEKGDLKNILIEKVNCLGLCEKGPNVILDGKTENYSDPIKISKIVIDKKK